MRKLNVSKEFIRQECLRKRRYLTTDRRRKFGKIINKTLLNLKEWETAENILIYVSTKYEAPTKSVIKKHLSEKNIIVPKTHMRFQTLSLHKITSFGDLSKGRYNILEPLAGTETITPDKVDLAIIPGVAFDKKGHRIGYGKAYYDKLLPHLNCPKIGLAYEAQLVKNIPAEKHDAKIDILITEKNIYHL